MNEFCLYFAKVYWYAIELICVTILKNMSLFPLNTRKMSGIIRIDITNFIFMKKRESCKKKKKILVLSVSNLYVWICLILLACQWIMLDPNCRSGEVIVKILVINRKWRVVYIINITYTLQFIINIHQS